MRFALHTLGSAASTENTLLEVAVSRVFQKGFLLSNMIFDEHTE